MEHKCHKEEIITEMKKALNGNGQPGVIQRVERIDQNLQNLGENMKMGFSDINKRLDKKDQKSQFNVTTVIGIGALIIAIIAIFLK